MARGRNDVPGVLDALGHLLVEPQGICRDGQRSSASLRHACEYLTRGKMTSESKTDAHFRSAIASKKPPKAAVDGVAGLVLAFAEGVRNSRPDIPSTRHE